MPLNEQPIETTEDRPHCPDCGDQFVTPRESLTTPDPRDVIDYGGPSEVTYKHVCWNCGWTELVTMQLTRETTSSVDGRCCPDCGGPIAIDATEPLGYAACMNCGQEVELDDD